MAFSYTIMNAALTAFYKMITGRKPREATGAERAQRAVFDGIEDVMDTMFMAGPSFRVLRQRMERQTFSFDPMIPPVVQVFSSTAEGLGDVPRFFDQYLSKEVYTAGRRYGEEKWQKTGEDMLRNFAEGIGRATGIPFEGMVDLGKTLDAWGQREEE